MSKAELPQVLKRLDVYLRKHGLMITEPYDGIRFVHQSETFCTLCGDMSEGQIYIPSLAEIQFSTIRIRTVCANLERCDQRRKDNAAREKASRESRLQVIEEHLVFPEGEA